MVGISDVSRYPEKLGHLLRISRLVEGVVGELDCRVEIWDGGLGGCQGVYLPSSRLIKLWSGSSYLALVLVHELAHSLMKVGHSSWNKWVDDPYLGDGEELFARAVVQHVATVTGDRTLNLQLDTVREFHWTPEEFSRMEVLL